MQFRCSSLSLFNKQFPRFERGSLFGAQSLIWDRDNAANRSRGVCDRSIATFEDWMHHCDQYSANALYILSILLFIYCLLHDCMRIISQSGRDLSTLNRIHFAR